MNVDLNRFKREVEENPNKFYNTFQKNKNSIFGETEPLLSVQEPEEQPKNDKV